METTDMKSLAMLGSAIWILAFALNTTAVAEPKTNLQAQVDSVGYQCRLEARAELKGPNCRVWMPPDPSSSCNIPTQTEVHIYDNKTLECVRRGGPGRQAKTGSWRRSKGRPSWRPLSFWNVAAISPPGARGLIWFLQRPDLKTQHHFKFIAAVRGVHHIRKGVGRLERTRCVLFWR
jgi:hypothetical protein